MIGTHAAKMVPERMNLVVGWLFEFALFTEDFQAFQ
jgi:hypothetical protein